MSCVAAVVAEYSGVRHVPRPGLGGPKTQHQLVSDSRIPTYFWLLTFVTDTDDDDDDGGGDADGHPCYLRVQRSMNRGTPATDHPAKIQGRVCDIQRCSGFQPRHGLGIRVY